MWVRVLAVGTRREGNGFRMQFGGGTSRQIEGDGGEEGWNQDGFLLACNMLVMKPFEGIHWRGTDIQQLGK